MKFEEVKLEGLIKREDDKIVNNSSYTPEETSTALKARIDIPEMIMKQESDVPVKFKEVKLESLIKREDDDKIVNNSSYKPEETSTALKFRIDIPEMILKQESDVPNNELM